MQDRSPLERVRDLVQGPPRALRLGSRPDPRDAAPLPGRGSARARPRAGRGRPRRRSGTNLATSCCTSPGSSCIAEERGEFTPDDVADGARAEDGAPPSPSLRPRATRAVGAAQAHGAARGVPRRAPTYPARLCSWRTGCRSARRASGSTGPTSAGRSTRCGRNSTEVEEELSVGPRGPRARIGRPERARSAPATAGDEIGDLLFAVVNLARKAGVQPGPALDRTNRKFRRRFDEIERMAVAKGIEHAHGAGLEVLDRLWDEVKAGVGA